MFKTVDPSVATTAARRLRRITALAVSVSVLLVLVRVERPVAQTVDQVTLATFGDGSPVNDRGGTNWAFWSAGGTIGVTYANGRMQLAYAGGQNDYEGLVLPFPSPIDTTGLDAVDFEIACPAGGAPLRIGLGDENGEIKVPIAQVAPCDGFRRVISVPLSLFVRLNRQAVNRVVFVFEGWLGGAASGTVEIDNLRFVQTGTTPMFKIANFDQPMYQGGTGRPMWVVCGPDGGQGAGAFSDGAYAVSVDVTPPSQWCVFSLELHGIDVQSQDHLRFKVKGLAGGEQANIYLVSGQPGSEIRHPLALTQYASVTTGWTLVDVPLADAAILGIDLSALERIDMAFEWTHLSQTLYLDDVVFTSEPRLASPRVPRNLLATSPAVGRVDLTWTDPSSVETGFVIGRGGISQAPPNLTIVGEVGANVTSFSFTTCTDAGESIHWYVRSKNAAGESDWLGPIGQNCDGSGTIPAQPSNLVAHSPAVGRVDLTWTDGSNNETGFTIGRGGISQAPPNLTVVGQVGVNVTSFSFTTCTDAGESIHWYVRSKNAAGASEWVGPIGKNCDGVW